MASEHEDIIMLKKYEENYVHVSFFSKAIIKQLRSFYKQEYPRFSDVTLICNDNKAVEAHRLLLSLVSDYFNALFKHEPDKKEYSISEFDSDIIGWIVKHVCGADDDDQTNSIGDLDVIQLVKAADYFQIPSMMTFLAHSREVQNVDNSFTILKMSEVIDIPSIESSYIKHVNENIKEFHENNKLEALSIQTLHKIFKITYVPKDTDAMSWSKLRLIIIYEVLKAKNDLESFPEFVNKYFRAEHLYYFATADDSTYVTLPEYKIAVYKSEEDEESIYHYNLPRDFQTKRLSKFHAKVSAYNLVDSLPDLCQRLVNCLPRPAKAFLWDGLYTYWTENDRYDRYFEAEGSEGEDQEEDHQWTIDANKTIWKIKTRFIEFPNHPTIKDPILKGLVVHFHDGTKEAVNMDGDGGSDEDTIEFEKDVCQIMSVSLCYDQTYKTISSIIVDVFRSKMKLRAKKFSELDDFILAVPKNQDRRTLKEKRNMFLNTHDLIGAETRSMSGIRGRFSEVNGIKIISKLDVKLDFYMRDMYCDESQYWPGFWPPSP